MTAYSRRGFRIRLILEDYNDHRKKCFFFINILREKCVRNVIQRIWHFFYKGRCSAPDDLSLEIDDFFIPPEESTLVLKENDLISVRVRPAPAGGAPGSAGGAVRSTLAPLTAAPGTLVESVALVLRRLQDGTGPTDSQRHERDRLTKVAELLAAESGSSDVSTDEDGVRDLANQLTSRQEVVRLSQKMADQATPPPPCAARKHDLDRGRLTLTEVSRELRRRYEAGRQPQPASSPLRSAACLDSPAPLLQMANGLELEASSQTRQSVTSVTEGPEDILTGAAGTCSTAPVMADAQGSAALGAATAPRVGGAQTGERQQRELAGGVETQSMEAAAVPGRRVDDVKTIPRSAQPDAISEETGRQETAQGARRALLSPVDARMRVQGKTAGGKRRLGNLSPTAPLEAVGRAAQAPVNRTGPTLAERACEQAIEQTSLACREMLVLSNTQAKQVGQSRAGPEVEQLTETIPHPRELNSTKKDLQKSKDKTSVAVAKETPIITRASAVTDDVTPAKRAEKADCSGRRQNVTQANQRGASATGAKRTHSPTSSSSGSGSSSEDDSSVTPTPSKKPAVPPSATAAGSDHTSAEKKKKTRTRRRRGKKRRTPEATPAPPPPPPPPRAADYTQRHGLPRGEIDRYKRAASVGLGWQTRPKNRRVVFDDEGNPVPAGAGSVVSVGAAAEDSRTANGQWAWSQGRRDRSATDGGHQHPAGWSRPDHRPQGATHPSRDGATMMEGHADSPAAGGRCNSSSVATADHSGIQARTDHPAEPPSVNGGRGAVQDASALPCTSSSLPASATSATVTPSSATSSARPAHGPGAGRAGSLGAGLLPRAFMRPRRCVDPPRRSEPLRRPAGKTLTPAPTGATSECAAASTGRGSDTLLRPRYLMEGRGAAEGAPSTAAGTGRAADQTEPRVENPASLAEGGRQSCQSDGHAAGSAEAGLTSASARDELSGGRTPRQSAAAPPVCSSADTTCPAPVPASTISPGPARSSQYTSTPVPASVNVPSPTRTPLSAPAVSGTEPTPPAAHTTVVLGSSGEPAEASHCRDLHRLANGDHSRPVLVVRRHRQLPGRAAYREFTQQSGLTPRQGTGYVGAELETGAGTATAAGAGSDVGNSNGTSATLRDGSSGHSGTAPGTGGSADSGDSGDSAGSADSGDSDAVAGSGGESRAVGGPVNPAPAAGSTGQAEDCSPSGDVYSNVSVLLAGPPLEQLSPLPAGSVGDGQSSVEHGEDSYGSEDSDGSEDSEDSGERSNGGQDSAGETGRPADTSVDSISNCNVVNAVGQSRRLEKQRSRGLPPGGDKENQAPTDRPKDDNFYSQFPLMKDMARKGDLIAFKCWEMAADYTPYVSGYREASVTAVDDQLRRLTFQLLEYRPRCRRRGRFEIATADDDEIVDLEEESGVEERCWSELIQPRLLHP